MSNWQDNFIKNYNRIMAQPKSQKDPYAGKHMTQKSHNRMRKYVNSDEVIELYTNGKFYKIRDKIEKSLNKLYKFTYNELCAYLLAWCRQAKHSGGPYLQIEFDEKLKPVCDELDKRRG